MLFASWLHGSEQVLKSCSAEADALTLWTPEAGILAARYIYATARSRYTGGTVINATGQKPVYRRHGSQRHRPEVGIPDFFSNAYWHRNAQVIEIQTRQQLKNNYFHETANLYEQKKFAFGHLAANVRVRCSDFSKSKLPVYAVYSNRRPPSLFDEHCAILRRTWRMCKTLKRW